MKKIGKIILIALLIIVVVIQFVPANLPENKTDNPGDIALASTASEEVMVILKTSCYDCHSNQANLPWYSKIAPVSWLLAHDMNEGRKELNFSEWGTYPKRRLLKKLEEIGEEVEEEEMPLPIYTVMHGDANLSADQRKLLVDWTKTEGKHLLEN